MPVGAIDRPNTLVEILGNLICSKGAPLTPDLTPTRPSNWPIESYQAAFAAAVNSPSYDKEFVRDWLEAVRIDGKPWDKTPAAPRSPDGVIAKTAAKYQKAFNRLMT